MDSIGMNRVGNLASPPFIAGAEAVAAATAVIAAAGIPHVKLTPLAARIAAERGIDINTVHGNGHAGKIFAGDLQNASAAGHAEVKDFAAPAVLTEPTPLVFTPPVPVYASAGEAGPKDPCIKEEKIENASKDAMVAAAIAADEDIAGILRMNDARRTVAAQTSESASRTAAVTQHMETNITALIEVQERINAGLEKPAHLPLAAFYLKAMASCVREFDRFRMRLAESADAYLMIEGAPVGFQIQTGDSVTALVLRDADLKPLEEIAAEILTLTEKAKRGGLSESDTNGSAVTLIDKGESAVHAFTPIINLPEAAALGIGAPYQRLVMTNRAIENRQFVMQSLTFDYRVINGAEADEFQKRMNDILEEPQSLVG